jgi:hypothetical protein
VARNRLNSPFRVEGSSLPINVTDLVANVGPNGNGYTPGATIIDLVRLGPGISSKWTLLSISVQGYLQVFETATAQPLYGRLGRIIAGLTLDSPPNQTQGSGPQPWTVPMLPITPDTTLTTDLWNPASDPMPPTQVASIDDTPSKNLPVQANIVLPVPYQVIPGVTPTVGIWMTPSILATSSGTGVQFGLLLTRATWTADYDDGS